MPLSEYQCKRIIAMAVEDKQATTSTLRRALASEGIHTTLQTIFEKGAYVIYYNYCYTNEPIVYISKIIVVYNNAS